VVYKISQGQWVVLPSTELPKGASLYQIIKKSYEIV